MPGTDQQNMIEVSTLGPGFGECIIINIGNNDWIVVDSCTGRGSKKPAALDYLEKIGVDPAEAVKLIVATHWHDDHVRGLAETYSTCSSATFVCSAALNLREFFLLAERYRTQNHRFSSGINEFRKILDTSAGCNQRSPIKWATADRRLWSRPASGEVWECEVWSLSPSDKSFAKAQRQIADLALAADPVNSALDPHDINPNNIAVVLAVFVGGYSILLGSDLEETADPDTGWTVIINSNQRPKEKAGLFKVPHHGSRTADQPLIWDRLLNSDPIAVLTPFTRLAESLPTKDDAERILGKTANAYITSLPTSGKQVSKDPAVRKTLAEMGAKVSLTPPLGQVKITVNLDDLTDFKVDFFGAATALSNVLKSNVYSLGAKRQGKKQQE